MRKLVADELRRRNRYDIVASYTDEVPTSTHPGGGTTENGTEPVPDIIDTNRSMLLFDGTSRSAKSTKTSFLGAIVN